jgi:apurinic endonuclease APN1
MKNQLLLGAHLFGNISPFKKFEMASHLGLQSFQIFTASNLSYSLNFVLKQDIIDSFHEGKKTFKDIKVFSHACYLLNIANQENGENYAKSYQALCLEMERCQLLGIEGIVLHPGSFGDREQGLKNIADTINLMYQKNNFAVSLFLESSAGQGATLPVSIEEMFFLYELLSEEAKRKVKFTLDTCHLHASGYNLSTKEFVHSFFERFDMVLGLDKIGLLHLNDSLYECGSKKDRHANIGNGTIGSEGMKAIVQYPKLSHVYKILETPVSENIFFSKDIAVINTLFFE